MLPTYHRNASSKLERGATARWNSSRCVLVALALAMLWSPEFAEGGCVHVIITSLEVGNPLPQPAAATDAKAQHTQDMAVTDKKARGFSPPPHTNFLVLP